MEKQKSAVLQMFYGQRGDGQKVKCAPEYLGTIGKVAEYYKMLCEKLAAMPDVLELLAQFNEYLDRANVLEVETNYQEGFKFGLLIGIEAGESKFEK